MNILRSNFYVLLFSTLKVAISKCLLASVAVSCGVEGADTDPDIDIGYCGGNDPADGGTSDMMGAVCGAACDMLKCCCAACEAGGPATAAAAAAAEACMDVLRASNAGAICDAVSYALLVVDEMASGCDMMAVGCSACFVSCDTMDTSLPVLCGCGCCAADVCAGVSDVMLDTAVRGFIAEAAFFMALCACCWSKPA